LVGVDAECGCIADVICAAQAAAIANMLGMQARRAQMMAAAEGATFNAGISGSD